MTSAREQPFREDGNEQTARGRSREAVLDVEQLCRDPREGLPGALGEVEAFELGAAELDPKRGNNDHARVVGPRGRVEEVAELELHVRKEPPEHRPQGVERGGQRRRAARAEEHRQLGTGAPRYDEATRTELRELEQPSQPLNQPRDLALVMKERSERAQQPREFNARAGAKLETREKGRRSPKGLGVVFGGVAA